MENMKGNWYFSRYNWLPVNRSMQKMSNMPEGRLTIYPPTFWINYFPYLRKIWHTELFQNRVDVLVKEQDHWIFSEHTKMDFWSHFVVAGVLSMMMSIALVQSYDLSYAYTPHDYRQAIYILLLQIGFLIWLGNLAATFAAMKPWTESMLGRLWRIGAGPLVQPIDKEKLPISETFHAICYSEFANVLDRYTAALGFFCGGLAAQLAVSVFVITFLPDFTEPLYYSGGPLIFAVLYITHCAIVMVPIFIVAVFTGLWGCVMPKGTSLMLRFIQTVAVWLMFPGYLVIVGFRNAKVPLEIADPIVTDSIIWLAALLVAHFLVDKLGVYAFKKMIDRVSPVVISEDDLINIGEK